jgi:hypothetical protein
MEFLDFLKYGAIGVSLALAILSYRLLSKEQDKSEVRIPVLNSIKTYFVFALLLSVFFGSVEIVTKALSTNNSTADSSIEKIWNAHFSQFPDSTLAQKTDRILKNIDLKGENGSTDCQEIALELKNCKQELKNFDVGFYQNVIKLQNAIRKDADNWINLGYQIETKPDVIAALKGIFNTLGDNCDNYSDQQILEKWKTLKAKWTNDSVKMGYIFHADIAQIVKLFLSKFEDEK